LQAIGKRLALWKLRRRRRRIGLQIADRDRFRHAELGKATRQAGILRQHQVEGGEQRTA